jgi:DNA-binding HxlR family transcriptional regulator
MVPFPTLQRLDCADGAMDCALPCSRSGRTIVDFGLSHGEGWSVRRSPRSFEPIGDRWTLLILRSALYGVHCFDDLHADLDIVRNVLSNRVAGLTETGIMERREHREDEDRTRTEYPLTAMGRDLVCPRFVAEGRCH